MFVLKDVVNVLSSHTRIYHGQITKISIWWFQSLLWLLPNAESN